MNFMAADIPHSVEHCQPILPQKVERQTVGRRAKRYIMGNNLKKLRTSRDWTHEKAATEMGVSRSQFIKLERGERRLTSDYIHSAAIAFGVPEAEVIAERATVPLVGYVGAGAEAHYYTDAQDPVEEVPMPPGGNENTVAVEARGDSLGPFFW